MKKDEILVCGVDCTLCNGASYPRMPPDGDLLNSKVLIIGEAPGSDEDACGKPFMGRAGKLLKATLATAGVVNYVLDNVCRCRPPDNATPGKKEIETCFPHILETIGKMPNLKLIVPLGNVALQAL